MVISSFLFKIAYYSIGIGVLCYFYKAVGNKHNRKLEGAYQKALREGREPTGVEEAAHVNFKVMKFLLMLICAGVVSLILGIISQELEELL